MEHLLTDRRQEGRQCLWNGILLQILIPLRISVIVYLLKNGIFNFATNLHFL